MDTFRYTKPATVNDAMSSVAASGAKFVAGADRFDEVGC